MGGSDAIRGYLTQTLVCLINALQFDGGWLSVTMEPDRGNTQVDFIWQYADKRRVVQVKSSVEFTLRGVREAAEELERVEADEHELILAGDNFGGKFRDGQLFGKVVVKLVSLKATDLKANAVCALDEYLTAKGYPLTSIRFKKMAVAVLAEHVLTESIYSRTLSREDLDDLIDLWLLPVLNAQALSDVTREVKEMEEFKALFQVDEPNSAVRRAAVDFYHKTSMKNKHLVIKDAIQYLGADSRGHLIVRIAAWEHFFNWFFLVWAMILMLLPVAATPVFFNITSSTLFFIILMMCAMSGGLGFLFLHNTNPFIQALRIRRELSKLTGEGPDNRHH
jgi:hypothetical protein